jgi:hypothetical protein
MFISHQNWNELFSTKITTITITRFWTRSTIEHTSIPPATSKGTVQSDVTLDISLILKAHSHT